MAPADPPRTPVRLQVDALQHRGEGAGGHRLHAAGRAWADTALVLGVPRLVADGTRVVAAAGTPDVLAGPGGPGWTADFVVPRALAAAAGWEVEVAPPGPAVSDAAPARGLAEDDLLALLRTARADVQDLAGDVREGLRRAGEHLAAGRLDPEVLRRLTGAVEELQQLALAAHAPSPLASVPAPAVVPPPVAARPAPAAPRPPALHAASAPAPAAPPRPAPRAPSGPAPTAPTAPTATATTRPAPTNPAPTNPAPTNPAPTNPAPTNPAPTDPAPTNPAPTNPAPTNPAPTAVPGPAPHVPSRPRSTGPGAARLVTGRTGRATLWLLAGAGGLLVADAATTLLWQEPLSAVSAARQQAGLAHDFDRLDARLARVAPAPPPAARQTRAARTTQLAVALRSSARAGDAVARLRIPRIGGSWVVVQGAGTGPLRKGPGHYPTSSLPGRPGTTAIAGHRTTYGAPFRRIDELRAGDPIVLRMPYGTFTYRVEGHRIVTPSDVGVLRDVGRPRLVLTACHPLWSASRRYVVAARLVRAVPARRSGAQRS